MGANEQVLQRRSSGKPRNHWSPDSSDVEDTKGFGENDGLVKLKTLMREMLSIKNVDENNEELTSFVVWQKTKTRPIEKSRVAITFDLLSIL